jgi:hypothetical protein
MTFILMFSFGMGCFIGFFEKELTNGFGYQGRWFKIK